MARVVVFGDEQGEEERVQAPLFRPHEIKVAVLDTLADVAAAVELAVDDVQVRVKNEHLFVQLARVVQLARGEREGGGEKLAAIHAVWRNGSAGAR